MTATTPSILTSPKTWIWHHQSSSNGAKDWPISYQSQGNQGPAVVFVHGFGASWGHWRQNLPVLASTCRCYAIDLIGFGGSVKPTPGEEISYTFETWGQQIADFCRQVVGGPAFLVGNSIGCIAAMQAATYNPDLALGVVVINCSLRMLHDRKRASLPWYRRYGAALAQKLFRVKIVSQFFFKQLAKRSTVRKVLLQAYKRSSAVTDELIDIILKPASDRGAVDVFVAFTTYSQGPLAEDLLPKLSCPVLILWGTDDPWEPIEIGREFAKFESVDKFIPLEGLGHCPHDEAPEVVNPILQEWLIANS